MIKINGDDIISINNGYNEDLYVLTWRITDWNNFDSTLDFLTPTESDILNAAQKIHNFLYNKLIPYCKETNRKIKIKLDGGQGEVTYYNLINLLQVLDINDPTIVKVYFQTNFSRDNDYYLDLLSYVQSTNTTLGMVAVYDTRIGTLDYFLNKVINYRDNGGYIKTSIEVNDLSDIDFIKKAKDNDIFMRVIITKSIDLTEDDRKIIDEINTHNDETKPGQLLYHEILVTTKDNEYTFYNMPEVKGSLINGIQSFGYYCNNGTANILIKVNGDIVLNSCPVLKNKSFGNIYTSDFEYEPKKYINYCTLLLQKTCPLSGDFDISKNKEDLEEWH